MDQFNQPNTFESALPPQPSEKYEEEIKELERRLQEKRAAYEQSQRPIEHKEMLSEAIEERLQDFGVDVAQEQANLGLVSQAHPAEQMTPQTQTQLQELVNDVFSHGVEHAVHKAEALNNPYLLVLFRDALALHFYPVLVERGIIQEM